MCGLSWKEKGSDEELLLLLYRENLCQRQRGHFGKHLPADDTAADQALLALEQGTDHHLLP